MNQTDNFINIEFSKSNLDRYYIRSSIKKAIDWAMPSLQGDILDIGCGKMPYKDYIMTDGKVMSYCGLDIEQALEYEKGFKPDFTWDGIKMPFEDDQFECAIGTEVLEHCPNPEVILKETYRVLKQDGVFFFTVPFLWNLHETPHDEYRYTPYSLKRHLHNSGFVDVEIYPTGGWHAAMGQMLGLWLKRSPLSKRKRSLLTYFVKPIMKYLFRIDQTHLVNFKEGQMITGMYGKAVKKL